MGPRSGNWVGSPVPSIVQSPEQPISIVFMAHNALVQSITMLENIPFEVLLSPLRWQQVFQNVSRRWRELRGE
jgi:hypothetical protein